jgi:hypothetical protein
MKRDHLVLLVLVLLVVAALMGCGADGSSEREDRGASAVEECQGHGGVEAFDDEVVICRDQSADEERGRQAIAACEGRGGVAAFDDDIVICRDRSFQEAAGG